LWSFRAGPIAGADGVSLNEEIADLAVSDGLPVLVEDARVVSRNDLPARAGPCRSGTIGGEHMQRFGLADGIEDLDVEAVLEAMKDRCRQSLAGGNGMTQ